MTGETQRGGVLSQQELMDWLRAAPRTLGWDALMAIDRDLVNDSLRHDYTERFGTHPLSRPVNGQAMVVDNLLWEYMDNVRFDAPTVSFEGSGLGSGWMNLTARAFAGTQLTVDLPRGGRRRVTKVERYTPLQGPKLISSIELKGQATRGSGLNQVRIDVSTGRTYRLTYADSDIGQERGGAFLQKQFDALPVEYRFCVLTSPSALLDGPLAPEEVRPRPFPLLDADGKPTEDGALLLFVSAKGGGVGQLPDHESDWPYPIPIGERATLLIGQQTLMSKVVPSGVRELAPDAEFQYDVPDEPQDVIDLLTATKGTVASMRVHSVVAPFAGLNYDIKADLAVSAPSAAAFSITQREQALSFSWKASALYSAEAPQLHTSNPDGVTDLDYAWKLVRQLRYVLSEDGRLTMEVQAGGKEWVLPVYRQGGVIDPLHYQHFSSLSRGISTAVASEVDASFIRMGGPGAVDDLRISGLVFPGGRSMTLNSVHLPMDLALFGEMESTPGLFELTPAQSLISAGEKLQLVTSPEQAVVEWSVEVVQGFKGSPGTISSYGEYTAPSSAEIGDAFTLVRVSAASNGHISSTLLSVTARSLMVNPVVFSASPTSGKTRMAAGSVDRGALEWRVSSSSGAALEKPPLDGDAVFDPNDRLYVPGSIAAEEFFSIDDVVVMNPRTGEEAVTSVLVVGKELRGEIVIKDDPELDPGQLRLSFEAGEGPIQGALWKVQIGGGSVDQNGIYTMDPAAVHGFAVITAELTIPDLAVMGNYLILPFPAVDLDVLKRATA